MPEDREQGVCWGSDLRDVVVIDLEVAIQQSASSDSQLLFIDTDRYGQCSDLDETGLSADVRSSDIVLGTVVDGGPIP